MKASKTSRIAPAALALFCGLLLGAPITAAADSYYVFGQVFQISSEDAEDLSIPDGALTGNPLPYHQVRVHDEGTGTLLGTADAGLNGEFTVIFDLPAGSSPDIECRVYWVVDGDAELLPAAREGLNSFAAIGLFNAVGLRVVSDEDFGYGGAGLVSTPGVGLVFTRIGKVEIPFISQDISAPNIAVAGLADFTPDPNRPGEVGVPDFRRAPFARRLDMFGDFGLTQDAGTPPCTGQQIDWYQVTVEKLAEPGDLTTYTTPVQDPVSKIATTVKTLPTLTVTHSKEKIGPYDGLLSPALTQIEGLYWVNRNQVGAVTNVIYSYPDLRVQWVTNPRHGLFRVSLTYYHQTGTAGGGEPIVELIDPTCFDPPLAPLHQVILRVDNHDLVTRFDHIYLRNPSTGGYLASGGGEVPTTAGAVDFNAEALCDIMHLGGTFEVEIHYTVEHLGGYLRNYQLNARSNDNAVNVVFANESFTTHTTPANPIWAGPASTSSIQGGFSRCGFDFNLVSLSRLHDGFDWVQRRHPERVYYVDP